MSFEHFWQLLLKATQMRKLYKNCSKLLMNRHLTKNIKRSTQTWISKCLLNTQSTLQFQSLNSLKFFFSIQSSRRKVQRDKLYRSKLTLRATLRCQLLSQDLSVDSKEWSCKDFCTRWISDLQTSLTKTWALKLKSLAKMTT